MANEKHIDKQGVCKPKSCRAKPYFVPETCDVNAIFVASKFDVAALYAESARFRESGHVGIVYEVNVPKKAKLQKVEGEPYAHKVLGVKCLKPIRKCKLREDRTYWKPSDCKWTKM